METNQTSNTVESNNSPLDIVFDTTSGISVEEQQEILAGISALTERSSLSSGKEAAAIRAKKSGVLFPVMVNVLAALILLAGVYLLSRLHVQDAQQIRDTSVTLGLTERALIQEIRRETSRQLSEKENEINGILSMLATVDAEYQNLQNSVETLSEAQRARASALLQTQEEYRQTLASLQQERTQVIEDSRQRENTLRLQAEERMGALGRDLEQREVQLSAAMEELRRLNLDYDRAARAETQLNVYYTAANNYLTEGRLDEAASTLIAMREFLSAPSLQGIRALETRRQTHYAAIAALEAALDTARRMAELSALGSGGIAQVLSAQDDAKEALAALQERNTALEQELADQRRAANASGGEQTRLIAEHTNTIRDLRAANAGQQQTLNQRNTELQTLRTESSGLREQALAATARAEQSESALEEQQRQNTALTQQRDEVQQRLNNVLQTLQSLQQ